MNIQRIISSPFVRAVQTIERLSKKIELEIEIDKRLSERRLSSEDLPDWLEKLKVTYDDFDLKLPGGESSREAAARIRQTVDDVLLNDNTDTVIIVTHGNILSLLINQFDNHFGFDQWRKMSNPDVYLLTYPNENYHIERMWKEEYNV
ncbi:2,3-bisphosphoglycerate-dependent phosphoglycerate mutase [Metabacillus malikii]|uniref:2,3-bisphosphoglycerate-dependent phosphoglycerate mutase n=2 Tax=Metabacillus malikii TaxID=1504265 RepID=A0ABT9ZD20_9BACI|nr:2,3-bisphosphoglycerate-dependent phosphoglycerate mutase [Metabacillus malikii]